MKDTGFVAYNFHHRDALDYVVSELKREGIVLRICGMQVMHLFLIF